MQPTTRITITLNGRAEELGDAPTLESLITRIQPRPPFAIEVNQSLVRRPDYSATRLRDGDQVEIVTLVGGG